MAGPLTTQPRFHLVRGILGGPIGHEMFLCEPRPYMSLAGQPAGCRHDGQAALLHQASHGQPVKEEIGYGFKSGAGK